jgi:N6-adenosine-specific RNA methylase IME4
MFAGKMIPFPNKKYQIIYADPPWSYKVWSEDKKVAQGTAKRHYNTMKIEDICNLPVKDLADKDCKLFLWVTPPCLREGLEVMKAWGFEYKTIVFCWVKTNPKSKTPFFGIGHWTASNCELVLAGLKKGAKLNRQSKSISQIDMSARGAHSVKPESIRNKIVKLCGDIPRIELFARQKTEGWDCWGNEV